MLGSVRVAPVEADVMALGAEVLDSLDRRDGEDFRARHDIEVHSQLKWWWSPWQPSVWLDVCSWCFGSRRQTFSRSERHSASPNRVWC